jgi:hypothetical protein
VNASKVLEIAIGTIGILMGILVKEFRPSGWTTHLIWGGGENVRIPRWVAATFYCGIGILLILHAARR